MTISRTRSCRRREADYVFTTCATSTCGDKQGAQQRVAAAGRLGATEEPPRRNGNEGTAKSLRVACGGVETFGDREVNGQKIHENEEKKMKSQRVK